MTRSSLYFNNNYRIKQQKLPSENPLPIFATPSDDLLIRKTVLILVLILFAVSLIDYSFENRIQILRLFLAYPLCVLTNALLCWWGIQASRKNGRYLSNNIRWLLLLNLSWGITLIARSVELNERTIRDLFFTEWGAMSFLLPFLAFNGASYRFWTKLMGRYGLYFQKTGIIWMSLVIFLFFNSHHFMPISHTILFLSPLLYLAGFHCKKTFLYLGFSGLMIWFIFAFMIDKREDMVLILWIILCSSIEGWHSVIFSLKEKIRLFFIVGISITVISIIGFQTIYQTVATKSFAARVEDFFYKGGMIQDTRQGFIKDFFRYRTFEDNIFGGGAVTKYKTGFRFLALAHLKGGMYRSHIEIGHLYHMLTGGIIQNIIFNFLACSAVFLGLFRSKNRFTYALSYYIIAWISLMFIAADPFGGLRYALVWLSIGGCCSIKLRSMTTESFMKQVLAEKSKKRLSIKW